MKEFIPYFQDKAVSLYDYVIPSKFNSTNIINLFNSLTRDILDIDNYNKIKDFYGLDINLEDLMINGIFAMQFIIDFAHIEMKFDKTFYLTFSNFNSASLTFKLLAFLTFSNIFYYYDNFTLEEMKDFVYNFFFEIKNYIKSSDILNKTISFKLR